VEGVHFLAHHGVFAFFCKYCDKKCTPGAIHQWMRGGWLVSWYVRLNFNTNWYWMKLSFCGIYTAYTKYSCHKWAILSLFWVIIAIFFMGWKELTLQKLILKSMVEEKMINHYKRRQNFNTGRNSFAEHWLVWT
jgi:hypothetical protein